MTSASSMSKPRSSDAVRQGALADRAVDIGDDPARPAHHMVMVVADAGFITSGRARRLDAAGQADRGKSVQDVVHGLAGDIGVAAARGDEDRFCNAACGFISTASMTTSRGTGHAESGRPQ